MCMTMLDRMKHWEKIFLTLIGLMMVSVSTAEATLTHFCPFCSAVNATFADQIRTNHIVVSAKLTKQAKPIDDLDLDLPRAELEIIRIFKGGEFVETGMRFNALLVGSYELGQEFLVMGVDPPSVVWSTPLKVNDRILEYIQQVQKLPEGGADRLAFFQKYFEDTDSVLAYDAYDEFAQAPYQDLWDLKERMDRKQLLTWISDTEVPVNRRRLYLTMLGICGQEDDAEVLEEIICSGDRDRQAGLDALVASYLMLTGEKGLDVVDRELIDNPKAEDIQLLSVRSSLAFHSTEAKVISRERLLKSLRKYLDKPTLADAVIPDLSRLKDWTVINRLVELFKDADQQHKWVRVPIIQYLQECPEPAAKTSLAELSKLDPDAVKRASFLSNFDFGDDDFAEKDGDEQDEGDDAGGTIKSSDQTSAGSVDGDDEAGSDVPTDDVVLTRRVAFPAPVNAAESEREDGAVPGSIEAEIGEAVETLTSLRSEAVGTPVSAQILSSAAASVGEPSSAVNVTNTGESTSGRTGQRNTPADGESRPKAAERNEENGDSAGVGFAVLTVPMLASGAIFLLIWSVISGWFERLIF